MDALLSPRRRQLLGALGGASVLGLAGCGQPSPQPLGRMLRFTGETMGTRYVVKVVGAAADPAWAPRLRAEVQAALDGVDRRMSLYRPDSELMRLNRHASTTPLPLSADLFTVLAAGHRVAELSHGAFDISVAPLVNAWGFGAEPRRTAPPEPNALSSRAAIGWQGLRLDPVHRTASKAQPALQADLGGIAKGYGVDLAARALEAIGIDNYMIEVGGEVRTRGVNAFGQIWRIGIEQPDAVPPRAHRVVPLRDGAMATSGDYRNYFEHGGRRYSHAIDPRTAAPIVHALASVTVIAEDCMHADALATALIVLGPERGWALADARGLAAYFIVRGEDGRLTGRGTEAFAALSLGA